MKEQRRWYTHDIRVRYQETDQMGVVYHANYLNWFEIGRTDMIRQLGIPYRTLEERGFLLPVIEVEMQFKLPARYDDVITIYTAVRHFDHVRIAFDSQIRRKPELQNGVIERTEGPVSGRSGGPTNGLAGAAGQERAAEPAEPSADEPTDGQGSGLMPEPEGELLVSGVTRHVWLNRAWRPTRIDKEAPDLYELLKRG